MQMQVVQAKKVAPVVALLLAARAAQQAMAAAPIPHDHDGMIMLSRSHPLTVPLNNIFDSSVYSGADAVTTAAAFGANVLIATGVMAMFGSRLFLLGLGTLKRAAPR